MATTSNFKSDSIKEIYVLSNGMSLTVNNILSSKRQIFFQNELQAIKGSSHMLPRNEAFLAA